MTITDAKVLQFPHNRQHCHKKSHLFTSVCQFVSHFVSRKRKKTSGTEFVLYMACRGALKQEKPHRAHKHLLINYIKYGGFPAIHLQEYPLDNAYTIVRDIYHSTIFSDIVRRNQVRKVDQLERVVKFVFDNVGKTFSAKSISDYIKSEHRTIDNETVYNYLEKLESAYILHRCSRYDVQGKELLKTQEKFYLADSSFKYSVLGYNDESVAAMLENVVYLELLRRGYEVCIGKTQNGEIDFIATKYNEKIYFQIAYQLVGEVIDREFKAFDNIEDHYPKYVISMDKFDMSQNGIIHKNIIDWLLDK